MLSERKLRLNQVAREFNVGLSTITDFLAKKGISIESSPSTLVGPEAYAVLEKEFGGNRSDGKVNIREKINVRHETVSLDKIKGGGAAGKESEPDFKDEVVIKTGGVISVKDEVTQRSPKILGKIDLSGGKSKPASSPQATAPQAAATAPKTETAAPATAKPAAAPAAEAKPAATETTVKEAAPAAAPAQPEAS